MNPNYKETQGHAICHHIVTYGCYIYFMSPLEELRVQMRQLTHEMNAPVMTLLRKYDSTGLEVEEKTQRDNIRLALGHEAKKVGTDAVEALKSPEKIQRFAHKTQRFARSFRSLGTEPELEQLAQITTRLGDAYRTALDKLGGPDPQLALILDLDDYTIALENSVSDVAKAIKADHGREAYITKFHRPIMDWMHMRKDYQTLAPSDIHRLFTEKKTALASLATTLGYPLTEPKGAAIFSGFTTLLDTMIARCEETMRGQGWTKEPK